MPIRFQNHESFKYYSDMIVNHKLLKSKKYLTLKSLFLICQKKIAGEENEKNIYLCDYIIIDIKLCKTREKSI